MKKLTLILFPFFLLITNIKSQDITDLLQYFPIHYGDIWTYKMIEYDSFNDDTLNVYYRTFEVTGDTLYSDGERYYIFSYSSGGYNLACYYRIDTANLMVKNLYHDWFYLGATPDSIWTDDAGIVNYVSYDTSEIAGLGIVKPKIIYEQGYAYYNRSLSKGLGITYVKEGDLGVYLEHFLVYAKVDGVEYGTPVEVQYDANSKLETFSLLQNYPNPFNPTTNITYVIASPDLSGRGNLSNGQRQSAIGGASSQAPRNDATVQVSLKIYDALGREVATLVNEKQMSGEYSVQFKAEELPSGIYFYTLRAGNFVQTRKMVLMK